eukprot:GFUD01025548.1.p1 GENE.GFUD01025548.1~~GFUD01025548.1.p1  ORF type:complete len:223 (-),score=74.43 GFUD01025548.1:98-766(-)
MTKLKKQRKKKTYNYGRNRSRVRKQQERTTKFNVKVDCKPMKDVWDNRISMKENMAAMGVALNANDVLPFAGTKKNLIEKMKKLNNVPILLKDKPVVTKPEVVDKLETEANVGSKQVFRFTTTQVQLITHMMDKHGMDFKAMSRDPKNHYQETPAKLKGMVTKFISIPEHYAPYCRERGLFASTEEANDPEKVSEVDSEPEDVVEEDSEEEIIEDSDEDAPE